MRTLKYSRVLVPLLLLGHAALLAWGDSRHSPTIDEVGHLPAGLSHWQFGQFDLYRVNPPLVRIVAALPVFLAQPTIDWPPRSQAPSKHTPFHIGSAFIAANGPRSFWYFTLARWACIPFSLLGGYICFLWARDLYGRLAGLLALTLWCFSPNILGNAQMITPDTGAAALGAAAGYTFWRWLRRPCWTRALLAGITLGLAELTKSTWIILFMLWPLLWLVWRWSKRRSPIPPRWRAEAMQLGFVLLFGLYMLNLGYGFEGSLEPLGAYQFASKTLRGSRSNNRFAGSWLGELPVPLPRQYLLGIDQQKVDFEQTFRSYLGGEWRQGGWWYYYLYGLAVKAPLGVWVLFFLVLELTLIAPRYSVPWRHEVALLAPAVLVLALVSSQTGFNHHLRYVLPLFPFVFIWISKAAQPKAWRGWAVPTLVLGGVLWTVGSSLSIYPHSLSYFNELAGGPANGHAHLVDSNIDWGQDLLYLKRWLDEHPEARPFGLAYRG
ncbi:MAG: glycosyltransferase family 39 protein, partial [Thermaceae bacterium]|nr:glycosyltransferase family 39 protein [Thermaceae bacterium]